LAKKPAVPKVGPVKKVAVPKGGSNGEVPKVNGEVNGHSKPEAILAAPAEANGVAGEA